MYIIKLSQYYRFSPIVKSYIVELYIYRAGKAQGRFVGNDPFNLSQKCWKYSDRTRWQILWAHEPIGHSRGSNREPHDCASGEQTNALLHPMNLPMLITQVGLGSNPYNIRLPCREIPPQQMRWCLWLHLMFLLCANRWDSMTFLLAGGIN